MLTLLINESNPLDGLFANSTTGGVGAVPDISVADDGQAVSVQSFTRAGGIITDSFVAGDVLHIGIGDGVNAPVCYVALSSASPAVGTMPINTAGMVALFAGTVANQLSLTLAVVRTRGAYTNTIFSAPIVIRRSAINISTAVPTPSILGTGVAAALQIAINTALGFVRLDGSARLPAVDGSQLTNLPNTGGVTSITGTANEITVTGTTTPTLSLPSALTFTAKTITGGTFASPSLTTPTIGDGTESAPSLSFTSDTNTGVYRPAADTVGIVGGGNDVVRLTGIASATDYLEIKNGIGVGSPLHVLAEGASANIGVHLQPKGSGLFTISDGADFNKGIRFRSSSSAASAITLLDAVSTAGRVVTLPDATGTLALVSGDLGTPSALVGTNITGTASGLTAGNATLAATVTVANEATDATCFPLFATAATGSLAAKSNAGITFNSATGLLSATGLAGAFNGTVGATTPSTVAGTTFNGNTLTTGTGTLTLSTFTLTATQAGNVATCTAIDGVSVENGRLAMTSRKISGDTAGNANLIFTLDAAGQRVMSMANSGASSDTGDIRIGNSGDAWGHGIAIGANAIAAPLVQNSSTTNNYSLAFGYGPIARGVHSLAFGTDALSAGISSVAIGGAASSSNIQAVAIGAFSLASGLASIAVGENTIASADFAVAIGPEAEATADNAIQLGAGTNATTNTLSVGSWNIFNLTTGAFSGRSITLNGSTSGSATISVSATGGLLALPSGTTATNMTLTTPALGTPSAGVLTNCTSIPAGQLTGNIADARNTVSNTTTTSMANLVTVGTLTGGATGAGFTVALSTSTITGSLADARLSANVPLKDAANTFTGTTNTFTLPTTTGTTTTSGIAVAGNSLTTGTGIYASSTSLTSGKLMELAVSPTGTQAPISLNLSATWNTSGSPTLLKGRITNTASGSYTSYLLDFGTVATRYFGLTAEGRLYLGSGGLYVNESNGALQNNGGNVAFSASPTGSTNNLYDLGTNATRWRTLYVATSIENSGTLAVTGATTLTGNLTSNGAYISTPQALSGNGAVAAVNLTTEVTTIANTGTANTTTTLAAGTNGQKKVISFITDGGFDAVITVTNPAWGGAGTITMNDALDNIELRYLNSVWQVFINNGCTLA